MNDRVFRLCVLAVGLIASCTPPRPAREAVSDPAVVTAVIAGLEREAIDSLAAEPWLEALERAVESDDPLALAATAAAVDALVLGRVAFGAGGLDQAIAHRSAPHMVLVSTRLQRLYHRAERQPFVRALVAEAIHALALRVGAPEATAWRQRIGCAQRAALAAPVGWPPLTSLSRPSPLHADAPFPGALPGLAPFARQAAFEPVHADACAFELDATSPLRGERLLVVDAPGLSREIFISLTSAAAAQVEIGGKRVLERPFDDGPAPTTRFARIAVSAGRARIAVRIAQRGDGRSVILRVLDAHGRAMPLEVPPAGSIAEAAVIQARPVPLGSQEGEAESSDGERLVVAAGAIALGRAREALALLDAIEAKEVYVEILRMRALEFAQLVPRTQRRRALEAAVARAEALCRHCWPVRLAAAAVAQERRGHGTGAFAALEALGVTTDTMTDAEASTDWTARLGVVELARAAELGRAADLHDVARRAYDALASRAPQSSIAADLDAALHRRTGDDGVQAACAGGTSRATTHCFFTLAQRGQIEPALDELDRLRALRGSQSLHRDLELELLVAHGEIDRAMLLYEVLSPAKRSLALLGALQDPSAARDRFARDMRQAADAPHAFEPLVRHLGVMGDPAAAFEREGAALVARDRERAFLPGAGTAVLRRIERYQLDYTGLFHFALYDLRRVSAAVDVAGGTLMGLPMVAGRAASRVLRRRIHKVDGRVLDPDPSADGAQGNTDLSALEAGDYVEVLVVGWALPDDAGQLVVDTPDLMPLRTSVREAEVRFTRPADLPLSLWRHDLLGEGTTTTRDDRVITTWRLANESPRRIEEGVSPLEARVALSFGTDSWARIADALAEHFAALDEDQAFVTRWAERAVGGEGDAERRLSLVVAAAGKALPEADPGALSDFVASLGGGGQRETARFILERGTGSRTWVIHRALRALGTASEIAVAEMRPFSAAPGFPPRVGRFVRPVLRVEIDGKTFWVDADVDGPPLPPGRVSPELHGRQALLADGSMVAIAAATDPDADVIDLRLALDAAGDAQGTFTALLHGRPAQRLAEAFEVVVGSERDALLRNVVLGWLPWADVRSVVLSSEPGNWQVAVRAEVLFVGFARAESRDGRTRSLPGLEPLHDVFPFPATSTVGAAYASQSGRSATLSIGEPTSYALRRVIELPAGAKITGAPAPLSLSGGLLAASRTFQQEGSVISESFRLDLAVGTVAPDAFEAFAERAREVDDGFQHGIRVEMP
jgi:hypothetical protein